MKMEINLNSKLILDDTPLLPLATLPYCCFAGQAPKQVSTLGEMRHFVARRFQLVLTAIYNTPNPANADAACYTEKDVSEQLGVDVRVIRKWASGDSDLPAWAGIKLGCLIMDNYSYWDTTGNINSPLNDMFRLRSGHPALDRIFDRIAEVAGRLKYHESNVQSRELPATKFKAMEACEIDLELRNRANIVRQTLNFSIAYVAKACAIKPNTMQKYMGQEPIKHLARGGLPMYAAILINHSFKIPRVMLVSKRKLSIKQIAISNVWRRYCTSPARETELKAILEQEIAKASENDSQAQKIT